LLQDPLYNKGIAFTGPERERFGLRGLLPPAQHSLQTQYERFMLRYREQESKIELGSATDLDLWHMLQSVKHRNRVLYYRILMENFQSMSHIIYTPTIGEVCQTWHHRWLSAGHKEMYFGLQDKGQMSSMVYNYPADEVDLVVVTDGSRVLGLGDLGINGAGICIGKLDLYIAAGGFDPARVMPVALDVGCDNEELRNDPYYFGERCTRLLGKEYYDFVDEFISAIHIRYPSALIHFEDFQTPKAQELLAKYRSKILCFNDDIQGTAAVALAAFLAYARGAEIPLDQLRLVCSGAGSSATGVLDLASKYLAQETGKPLEEIRKNFFVLDSKGLIGEGRSKLSEDKSRYISMGGDCLSLLETVKLVKPHILFGLSATKGIFTDEVLGELGKHHAKCLIMPMSNPTSRSECTIQAVAEAMGSKAVFASGSPFKDHFTEEGVVVTGNQCNNAFIFPGLVMGASLAWASRMTDQMLFAAAVRLSQCTTDEEIKRGQIFPRMEGIIGVTEKITAAVARCAVETSVATGGVHGLDWTAPDVIEKMRPYLWKPEYGTYIDYSWQRDNNQART